MTAPNRLRQAQPSTTVTSTSSATVVDEPVEVTVTALLALLDAASAIVQLPPDTRRVIDCSTVQYLLDNAKSLDRLLSGFTEAAEMTQRFAEENRETPSADLCEPSVISVNHVSPPNPPNGPKRRQTEPRPPKIAATVQTPVLPPIPAATGKIHEMNGIDRIDKSHSSHESPIEPSEPPPASNRIPFAEFDRLVRREMKRLAMDGRLPGHKLWDGERTAPLPTLAAVILRYEADGLIGLAEVLGLEPPLSVQKKASQP